MSQNPNISLQQADDIKESILGQVHAITRDVFAAFENEYTIFSPLHNCFELFGLDFLVSATKGELQSDIDSSDTYQSIGRENAVRVDARVDIHRHKYHVSLLEVNPGPDFQQTGQRLSTVIEALWDQTLTLIIDEKHSGHSKELKTEQQSVSNMNVDSQFEVIGDFTKVYDKSWSASQLRGNMTIV